MTGEKSVMMQTVQRPNIADVPFAAQTRLGAMRWLQSIDLDPNSVTHGYADREYWSWKTRDFANGTWQGGIAGFVDSLPLLELQSGEAMRVVEAAAMGTSRMQRSNGSFEEAYPYESSVAVTALVAFCWLYAWFRAPELFTPLAKQHLRQVVEAAQRYLQRTPETHGRISNHLFTAALALRMAERYQSKRPGSSRNGHLAPLLRSQHPDEGWFPEYGGADPGYQLLSNHYLIAAHCVDPLDAAAQESLGRSVSFCEEFTLPDGSYAGEVGSRGTAIVYPSGAFAVQRGQVVASELSSWVSDVHSQHPSCVNPSNVDAGNFVPVWNAWALASALQRSDLGPAPARSHKRSLDPSPKQRLMDDAGLFVAQGEHGKVIVSLHNGAYRYVSRAGADGWEDRSVVAFCRDAWSTQLGRAECEQVDSGLRLTLRAGPRSQVLNTPVRAVVLRALGAATYPIPLSQRLLKRLLYAVVAKNERRGRDTGLVLDIRPSPAGAVVEVSGPVDEWRAMRSGYHRHMASANSFTVRAL